jgi:myo-inositol-1(or 4)-monophosphatase
MGTDAPELRELIRFGMDIIRRAGDEALSYYGKGAVGVRFDEGLVTEAEIRLGELFQGQLSASFPDHCVFKNTELQLDYTHSEKRYLWVYDPLDGIANFQAGIPIWGLSLALMENFWPLFGIFYMPATADLFQAQAGGEAYRGSKPIRVTGQGFIDDESRLLTYSRFHRQYRTTFPGKLLNLGCTNAHICYVANGRADGALIANENFQSMAAARVIIEAAGGKLYRMDGAEVFTNEYLDGQKIQDHILVCSPAVCSSILRHLKAQR